MIFINITSGLGNQLFQYATARSLALDTNSDFLMNISYFNSDYAKSKPHVDFKLNHFNIDVSKQFTEDNLTKYENITYFKEPMASDSFLKYEDLHKFNGNLYLKGYFQNEKYFKNNANQIKNDLKIITPPNKKNEMMLEEINNSNAIALSFRRGDYLDSYFLANFGKCDESYYKNAIDFMIKNVENPVFYVFSDDMDWIEDNVKLDYPTIPINFNGVGYEYEELRLMKSCKHFILANSSFSWWGAWLSDYVGKLVIAPKPWFSMYTQEEMVCSDWISLKSDRSDLFNKSNNILFELKDSNIELEGIYKISKILNVYEDKANFSFNLNNFDKNKEYIIKLKLLSQKQGLIKVRTNEIGTLTIGYERGLSDRYLHLKDVDLNKLTFYLEDDSMIIEDIVIKEVDSDFDLKFN